MIRLQTITLRNIHPVNGISSGLPGTAARVLCSARDAAVNEPHPNAICFRPGRLRVRLSALRSSKTS